MANKAKVTLTDEDLRELFAIFSSPTDEELHRVLNPSHTNFYKQENLRGNTPSRKSGESSPWTHGAR
jgi:hypothetical protein